MATDPAPQPAPDYETIYDVERAFEPAMKAVLEAAIGLQVYTPRGVETLKPDRVDVQLQLGEERDTRGQDRAGNFCTTAWNAQFILRVVTPRFGPNDVDGNPVAYDQTAHGRIRAQIRNILQNWRNAFPSTVLPYHVLTQIMASGSSPQLELDDELDVSELAYNCVISVRKHAWPLVTP